MLQVIDARKPPHFKTQQATRITSGRLYFCSRMIRRSYCSWVAAGFVQHIFFAGALSVVLETVVAFAVVVVNAALLPDLEQQAAEVAAVLQASN